jgi:hypothetical protein
VNGLTGFAMQDNEKSQYEGNAILKEGQYGKYWGFGIKRDAE